MAAAAQEADSSSDAADERALRRFRSSCAPTKQPAARQTLVSYALLAMLSYTLCTTQGIPTGSSSQIDYLCKKPRQM